MTRRDWERDNVGKMGRRWIVVFLITAGLRAQALLNPERMSAAQKDFDRGFRDLPVSCDVMPIKPLLNFGFRFQAGYVARVPMNQYRGAGHAWTMITRVTPVDGSRAPFYFGDRRRLPPVPPQTKETFQVTGGFLLGEGKYQIDWKLTDDSGRVCSHRWTIDAHLGRSERQIKPALPPDTVTDYGLRGATRIPQTDDAAPIRLTVLMHAAPINPRRTQLGPRDQMMLLGTLSSLLDRVPVRSVKLVVFNLDQQKELYRREDFVPESMGQVSRAIGALELGKVDYAVLRRKSGHLDLLSELVHEELDAKEPPDVVLFLGPQARTSDKLARAELERPQGLGTRFFYIQYRSLMPQQAGLPDTINYAVNRMKGKTMVIRTPGDFARAIGQIEHTPPSLP